MKVAGERFWAKVDKGVGDGCWLWTAASNEHGYGIFWDGVRLVKAHRFAWALINGRPIPTGLIACHTCDTPSCVNPSHIFIGTQAENIADMVAKGRHHEQGPTCKRGHDLADARVYPTTTGVFRQCKVCQRERDRLRYVARKAAA